MVRCVVWLKGGGSGREARIRILMHTDVLGEPRSFRSEVLSLDYPLESPGEFKKHPLSRPHLKPVNSDFGADTQLTVF